MAVWFRCLVTTIDRRLKATANATPEYEHLCNLIGFVDRSLGGHLPVHSCPFLSFPVLSCPFLSFPVLSCPFLSFPVLSCPFLSFPVLARYAWSQCLSRCQVDASQWWLLAGEGEEGSAPMNTWTVSFDGVDCARSHRGDPSPTVTSIAVYGKWLFCAK
jgi:hypothetical protein